MHKIQYRFCWLVIYVNDKPFYDITKASEYADYLEKQGVSVQIRMETREDIQDAQTP